MNIEIRILSGNRSGERIVLDSNAVRLGTVPNSDVYFEPQSNGTDKGRQVTIRASSDGWLVKSIGSGGVLLNQSPVSREMPIRSGDLIRLSERGPDFTFSITNDPATPVASAKSLATSSTNAQQKRLHDENVPTRDATTVERTTISTNSPAQESHSPMWLLWLLGALAVLVLIAAGLSFALRSKQSTRFAFINVPDQIVPEESTLTLSLRVTAPKSVKSRLEFALVGDPPIGAEINSAGVFNWTPSESQGPGTYTCRVRASLGNSNTAVETEFRVEVREVNLPPRILPIASVTTDAGQEIDFSVAVEDRDEPANRYAYSLSGAPNWITINAESGVVRCTPPKDVDGRFEVTAHVRDDGESPLEGRIQFAIEVSGDPWVRLENEQVGAIHLVQLEMHGADREISWPYATSCAIRERTLITSALVVSQLVSLQHQGFVVSAVNPTTGFKTPIQALRLHREFVRTSDDPANWVYVNLGLLETQHSLPKTARLVSREELLSLEEGQPVSCYGFPHDGGKVTRFDEFVPILTQAELYLLNPSSEGSDALRLLELEAKLPPNIYGSPVFTQDGRLVAVFGQDAAVENHHFAATVCREMLDGDGAGNWVTPSGTEEESTQE